MSFSLTANFLKNARGLTFSDGGGVTWSFNPNTNVITVAGTGGSTLSSVGFADTSTAPIYSVSNSPLTSNGTIDITLNTQVKNLVFAGPTTGANAQPTFRALVVADLPSGYPYGSLSGAPSIPVGAAPTAKVALAAANGSAATFMRSDGAPALDVTISPTWTGNHNFTPTSGIGLTATAPSGSQTAAALNGTGGGVVLFYTDGNTGNKKYGAGVSITVLGAYQIYDESLSKLRLSIPTTGGVVVPAPDSGQALTVTGTAAGTATLTLNTMATTGAQTATFSATNKPGSGTTAPTKWLPVVLDGTTYYIPCWQ